MSTRISQQQLESYLWGAATLLRGTIDAGDYKQFIFPLLFYKRVCDVFDEETLAALLESSGDADFAAYPENHRFQVPQEAHWTRIRNVSTNVGRVIQAGMRAIETANPDKLYGIFGDAQWTNKDRLSDEMLRDLVEHFSALELSLTNLPEDELGQGYEYLIKKFADDAGHTAAEFYTNRTVVHLMTEMLQPQPGDSIYDPTCGSGGMLLSCITHLRRQGKEWRNVRLYGQERNLMTSSIARMNCFLHGIEDFRVERGDTLSEPKFVEGDRLMRFDVVLANPPYSIKQWDRDAFASDPWGRNLYGTPPQGRADYAFWQHILCSLAPRTGRCAILFPHGVLFRQEEAEMRRKVVEADVVECVLGLGPNLFYNSPMEACVVICRAGKPKGRRGRILFINAVNEVCRERAQSYLTEEHINRIVGVYHEFRDERGFARVVSREEVRANDATLSIPLYVQPPGCVVQLDETPPLVAALEQWVSSRGKVSEALGRIVPTTLVRSAARVASDVPELLKNREAWTRVRFGDVVENVNVAESNPGKAGVERFIGLEHLEPGSLHVRTWGSVADGTTFTRRCIPGQVLFGKRRAYQRKVAIAEFDAVVSGDIYVLAPKGDRLLPELLPFLCLAEPFFQHAVGTSAGSLSPRTNWSSLASFEFALPPVDEQRRIAEVLWAIDDVAQRYCVLAQNGADMLDAVALESFPRLSDPAPAFVRLESVCTRQPQSGLYKGPQFVGRGTKVVNMRELFANDVIESTLDMQLMDVTPEELDKYRLTPNDLLFGRRSIVLEGAGKCSVVGYLEEPILFESSILRITLDRSVVLPEYVFCWLNSEEGRRELARIRTFTTIAGVSGSALRSVRVPVATPTVQRNVVLRLADIRAASGVIVAEGAQARALLGRLVDHLMGTTNAVH